MSFWVAGATVAVGIGGAVIGSNASKKAANAAARSSDAAVAEGARQFDLVRSDTAHARSTGDQALSALDSIYGYQSPSEPDYMAGATQFQAGTIPTSIPGGKFNIGGNLLKGNSFFSKIHDPFASRHGDENRNLKAFAAESGVMQLSNGMLALPDGTMFPPERLQEVAGTWYGAIHAPDGNQGDWQQRYSTLLGQFQKAPGANVGQTTGQTSDGVPQGVTNGPQAPSPALTDPNSPNYGAFFKSPDYQFRKTQGMEGIGNSFSASGGAKSGNALKALADFNSNLAAGEFGNYFNRQAALAGIGQTATNTSANAGIATGQIVGNALQNAGNARASGIAGSANAWGGAASGIAQGLGYYMQQRRNPYGMQSGNWGYGMGPGSYA